MTKTRAYLRVSTETQDTASQRQQIEIYTARANIDVDEWHTDHDSGKHHWQLRELAKLLELSQPGDHIIVSEISRIARSTVGVLTFLQAAAERQISIHATQSNMMLDTSIGSRIIITVLALAAEIERELLSQRTKAALARRKIAGHHLGRPFGSFRPSKLEPDAKEIDRLLECKVSKRAIARIFKVSHNTLHLWLKKRTERDTQTLPLPNIETEPHDA